MRPTLTLLLSALMILGLAACGTGSQQSEPSPRSPGATTAADPRATGDATASAAVTVEGFAYQPPELTVEPGTQITFTSRDAAAHTVTAGTPEDASRDRFDGLLGELGERNGEGTTFSLTLDEPGTYRYFCRFHPAQMRATIVVAE